MRQDLSGKKVMVTGASKGIGKALVMALVAAGAKVAAISRNQDLALRELGLKFYPIDLAQVDQVCDQIQAVVKDFGGVDMLVTCAGMAHVANLSDTALADWQQVMNLNVTSVWQSILGVLPTMRSQRSGKILNVASIAGKQGFPGWGAYTASKFALQGMTQVLAAEERSHGIQVMSICPGSVNTPLWDTLDPQVSSQFDRATMLDAETVAEVMITMLQLPSSAIINDLVLMPNAGVL